MVLWVWVVAHRVPTSVLALWPTSLTSTRSAASCCETAGTYTRAQIRLPLRRKSRAERAEACLSCLRPLLLLLLLLLAAV